MTEQDTGALHVTEVHPDRRTFRCVNVQCRVEAFVGSYGHISLMACPSCHNPGGGVV